MAVKQKKIKAKIKLQIHAGKATPAPPVGPALGQYGVPLMDFCKEFNARTAKMGDDLIPVELVVFEDKSFTFVTKTPVTSELIKKVLGLKKGSSIPNKDKVGVMTRAQAEEVATIKMPDLSANDMDQAVKVIAGTARSMGVEMK